MSLQNEHNNNSSAKQTKDKNNKIRDTFNALIRISLKRKFEKTKHKKQPEKKSVVLSIAGDKVTFGNSNNISSSSSQYSRSGFSFGSNSSQSFSSLQGAESGFGFSSSPSLSFSSLQGSGSEFSFGSNSSQPFSFGLDSSSSQSFSSGLSSSSAQSSTISAFPPFSTSSVFDLGKTDQSFSIKSVVGTEPILYGTESLSSSSSSSSKYKYRSKYKELPEYDHENDQMTFDDLSHSVEEWKKIYMPFIIKGEDKAVAELGDFLQYHKDYKGLLDIWANITNTSQVKEFREIIESMFGTKLDKIISLKHKNMFPEFMEKYNNYILLLKNQTDKFIKDNATEILEKNKKTKKLRTI